MASPRILVVEDNPSDVFILRRALLDQEAEIELCVASDGEEAIQFLYQHEDRALQPCVVLLDLHLPKQDGLEVLKVIRNEPALNHMNVMIVTGAASPHEEAELRSLGMGYRSKPGSLCEFDELAADLITICKNSKSLV